MPSGEQQAPGGWNRIHLTVDDLDAAIAKLKATGGHFRNNVVQGVGGKQILLEDPSGNLIELFEPIQTPTEHRDVAQTPARPDSEWAKRVRDIVAGTKLLSTTIRTAARRAMFLASFATLVSNRPSLNI